ncbi:MAG: TlpA family protein disulfide reductase [Lachnospiraceae bacterium]|nr:TlpA family protein disulfide reductase [Lachnospiraceae bacterium]
MNKNKIWILLLAFVLLLGGGAFLYHKLAEKAPGSQLQTLVPGGGKQESTLPVGETVTLPREPAAPVASAATAESKASSPAATEAVTASDAPEADTTAPPATRDPRLQLAPDFTFYDAEGNAFKLSDFRGAPVVLNFWASWCPPCQMEMPDFETQYKEAGEEVRFLMVNVTDNQRETVEGAAAFIEEKGYTFPVYYDTAQEGARTYQAYSIPRTFFIDAEGYLIANALGAISGAILQQGINMIR